MEMPFVEPGGILDEIAHSNCLWTNPLSIVWMRSVRQKPGAMKFLPLAYAAGMVGYSLALLTRICTVVFRVFGLIPAIFHAISSKRLFPLKEQFAHLVESAVYVGTAVVGVICPPLGYYLDAKVLAFSSLATIRHELPSAFAQQSPTRSGLATGPAMLLSGSENISKVTGLR